MNYCIFTKNLTASSINYQTPPSSSQPQNRVLSSDEQTLILLQSNYKTKLRERHKRTRNIIWFNPPYSKNIRTNVAREFLKLIDKHFSKTSPLHKIFNRNTIKVSYSCLSNVRSVISSHNKRILRETISAKESVKDKNEKLCNCRNLNECPLNKMCLTDNLIYRVKVTTNDQSDRKTYIGMTSTTFI